MTDHDDSDRTEAELRSAVRSYAEDLHPADRLAAIRARTRDGSPSARTAWWRGPWQLAAGTAVAAAAVVVGAVVLVGPDPATNGGDTPAAAAGDRRDVTIYVTRGVGDNMWLYPRQVTTRDTGDPALDAVRALAELESSGAILPALAACGFDLDPRSVDIGERVVTVHFAGEVIPPGACLTYKRGIEARRQQLAWTVRSAIGWQGPVRATPGGRVVRADPAALSPILIDSPADGETVSSPVHVTGTSDTFEGTVLWVVTRADGGRSQAGDAMGGTLGERAPFEFTLALRPGEYTLRAFAESPEDGSLFAEDTTAFTVGQRRPG